MTEQVPDSCVFDGRRWVVTNWDGDTACIPTNEDLGIETASASTNNRSGRIDHFTVHEDRLYLFKVQVNLAEGSRDVLPAGARREIILRYEPWEIFDDLGHRVKMKEFRTENLVFDNLPLRFSGALDISYPYVDDWERPMTTDNPGEEPSVRARLTFSEGRVTDCRYPQGNPWQPSESSAGAGPDESDVVRKFARQVARRIAKRVIADLKTMKSEMSGELPSVWEEICVQVQGEHSLFWDAYDVTVCQVVRSHIAELPQHYREALWLQTEFGRVWTMERDEVGAEAASIDLDEIIDYLKDDYIYAVAEDWSNARVRAFFEARYERD